MQFKDNILKQYLKNVYFVTGTPCGGKTTISRELSSRHGIAVYDVDRRFEEHQRLSSPEFQPAMNKKFASADEFFGRSVEEYKQWLLDNTREQLDFILLDLIRLSSDKPIICDLHLTVEQTRRLTERERVVFLLREPSNLVEEYCNRADHGGFAAFINSATDPEAAKAACSRTLDSLNRDRYESVKRSEFFWLERTEASTVEDTVSRVERHFGLM